MKLKYKKQPAFPKWALINPDLADQQRYYPYKDGIKAFFNGAFVSMSYLEKEFDVS